MQTGLFFASPGRIVHLERAVHSAGQASTVLWRQAETRLFSLANGLSPNHVCID